MPLVVIRFDLRTPAWGPVRTPELHAAALDYSAWADEQDLDLVVLSEHHGIEDGYLPSPLVFGGAVAGRTRRIGISVAALLVPLHDPLRLAEDIAVLDLASGGRLSIVAGIGYRPRGVRPVRQGLGHPRGRVRGAARGAPVGVDG